MVSESDSRKYPVTNYIEFQRVATVMSVNPDTLRNNTP